ncbi:hypothetical protein HHK36_003289 [Tetracentron sinense]|uniref:Uncharacterized protein n=1 Tax=Tetracentron sinense TaxID=13715 RepID=A0A834ZY01_TETSI|nr:hypothetical protein HHK36_003289 [Tetracentron sinense]
MSCRLHGPVSSGYHLIPKKNSTAFLRRVRERRAVCSGSLPLKAKEKGVVALNLLYFPYLFISTNKAVVNMISNLVNSTVPIAVEIFKKAGTYDEKKLFGVTTLDVVRAKTSFQSSSCTSFLVLLIKHPSTFRLV